MHPLPHFGSQIVAIGALVFFFAGLFLCRFGVKLQKKYDFLKDPPLVWIEGMPRGFVHARGKAVFGNPLTSPLGQLPCCYYRTTIERLKPGKKDNPGTFRKIFDEANDEEFYINDGTGRVLVTPGGAEYKLPKTYSAEIDLEQAGITNGFLESVLAPANAPTEQHLRRYLVQHGFSGGNGSPPAQRVSSKASGVHRLTEYCLRAGQEVSVFATCDECFSPESPKGCKVLCLDEHLPKFLISSQNELPVGLRLRLLAIVSFTGGIVMLGAALAGVLLLAYSHFD
jgi:hypothetical protein